MAVIIRLILISALIFKLLAASSLSSYGTYFEEITGNSYKGENSPMKEMFNENFYHCSFDKSCAFLIKNFKEGTYQKTSTEAEFPKARDGLLIWKKITIQNETAEQITTKQGYKSCKKAKQAGVNESGLVELSLNTYQSVRGYCDMNTTEGGWLVFQRRINGRLSFNRTWSDYVNGFGTPTDNYWLGLEAIHRFTKGRNVTLRVDLQDMSGRRGFAEYKDFEVRDVASKYTLKIGNYTGDIGDSLRMSNNMKFTTKDQDNDKLPPKNCATYSKGGWWHNRCFEAHLNGLYPGQEEREGEELMTWFAWSRRGIVFSEMKFRPNN